MRYAIYFTPPADHPLTVAANRWLGREAFSNQAVKRPSVEGISADELERSTAAPRRYGFHATLMAPFHLAAGCGEQGLVGALDDFAATRLPGVGPKLGLRQIGSFFALMPDGTEESVSALADCVIQRFNHFRAPLSEDEFARRASERLSARERQYLERWGYPYVFESFRFHLTLTGPVSGERTGAFRQAILQHFGPVLDRPLELSWLALFREPGPGLPFTVHSLHAFGARNARKRD